MQSSMASLLWESTGITDGFDLPDEETVAETVAECLFLKYAKHRPLAILLLRCLKNLTGETSDLFGSLIPQPPPGLFFFAATLLIQFLLLILFSFLVLGMQLTWFLPFVSQDSVAFTVPTTLLIEFCFWAMLMPALLLTWLLSFADIFCKDRLR